MDQDSYLIETARAMIAAAEHSRSVVRVLKERSPSIYRQLGRLKGRSAVWRLWGRSYNIDENAHQTIVHPAILGALSQLAGISLRGRIVHAGLEHTYGYLFSLLDTPYGYKRERWTQSAIEDGLGIDVPTLRPQPEQGTLLTNVTWFAGQIAFHDRPGELRLLQRTSDLVSPIARHYPYTSLEVCRVIEEPMLAKASGARFVRLQTDLVTFPRPPAGSEADSHLLIYSVIHEKRARLVTVFPVSRAMVEEYRARGATETARTGLPFNAYVPGLSGHTFAVRRYVAGASGN